MSSRASSTVLAIVVLLGLVGCGRTELFGSRKRCAPTDRVCQMQLLDGGAGNGGKAGIDGGPGSGGRGGTDGGAGVGGQAGFDARPDGDARPDTQVDRQPDVPVPCVAMPENCSNGKDDNCNGLVDCNDLLCMGDIKCSKPGQEICNNNLDDDDDGKVDCADTECMGNRACVPTMGPEICDNGKDDNNDSRVDCADPQCTKFPGCLTLVCKPEVDFGTIAAHGAKASGTFETQRAMQSYTTCAPPGGKGQAGTFVLTETADVRMELTQGAGSAHAVGLFRAGASQACDRNPVRCVNVGDDAAATHTYAALPAGTYFLVVQSYPGTQGTVQVTLSTGSLMTPEQCANGKDDDGNGLIDCQDQACRTAMNCQAVQCTPDAQIGALVIGATPKNVSLDLTQAPNQYKPPCAGNMPTGGNAVVAFTLPETSGIAVSYRQTGRTLFALYREPEPGFACDDGDAYVTCSFEDSLTGAVAFSPQPPGRYMFIFKSTTAGEEGTANLRISAFGNRGMEECANGIDDDGNELVDCDDPTCIGIGMCGASACMPDLDLGAFDIGTTRSTAVDTRNAKDLFHNCGKGNGKERVIRLVLNQQMALGFDCTDSGSHLFQLSQQLQPLDKCDAHNRTDCADPETLPFGCGFSIPSLQPGTYILFVEAFQTGDEGVVNLTLTGIREIIREVCDDGMDNDNDGATDCMDLKCVTSVVCEKFACRPDQKLGILPLDGGMATAVVQTSSASDDQTQTACVSAGGGQDNAIDFQLPARANIRLDWAQVGNHAFALYSDDGPVLSCEAGRSFGCVQSLGKSTGFADFNNLPAGRYHLVIDADRPGAEGGVAIQLSGKAAP
jgi:hypothetical protein